MVECADDRYAVANAVANRSACAGMGILVACYGDSYGDTGSVEAWVPEVADQTVPQTTISRYHLSRIRAIDNLPTPCMSRTVSISLHRHSISLLS